MKDDQLADLKPPLSSLLAKLCWQCSPSVVHLILDLHKETLKSMVRDVDDEEDKGRNVMMFGVNEDGDQSLDEKNQSCSCRH